jgi:serine/threonine protein kinase
VIWRASHGPSGREFAIKVIPVGDDFSDIIKEVRWCSRVAGAFRSELHFEMRFCAQIKVMKQCNSSHIVKFYGKHFNDEELWVIALLSLLRRTDTVVSSSSKIIMEYCKFGSLSDLLAIVAHRPTEAQVSVF